MDHSSQVREHGSCRCPCHVRPTRKIYCHCGWLLHFPDEAAPERTLLRSTPLKSRVKAHTRTSLSAVRSRLYSAGTGQRVRRPWLGRFIS